MPDRGGGIFAPLSLKELCMKQLTLEQVADYLESATIEQSHDVGHAIVHIGRNEAGGRFVMVNDCYGKTTVSES